MTEHVDIGRLILSPRSSCLEQTHASSNEIRCAEGVRGRVTKRLEGIGARYPSIGSVARCWNIGRTGSTNIGASIVGIGVS